ncbi:lymphocyte cytosolic protein 2-like [Branchiostoma floridae]|uniref:Lymphocyte cytosolic protein 2-like n=1 Tax=Branchiostoma floridae TaxID=7739 RepID=A0A9J7MNM0_BRAFL|nr:lymphocyte cytosolic protein 2-like [Branchiostoma floridae]
MVSKNPSTDEVQGWGPGEVAEWLAQIGLQDCVRFFQDRRVTGQELLNLDEAQLFRWQDLPIKSRKVIAKHIETLKSKKQEKKSKFSLFAKSSKPQLPSKDYQEPTSPDDDGGWDSDEFDDTLTTMRQESIEWQECLDDNGFKYYWNITTNETSWDRPEKFMPVDSGTQEIEEDEDAINDYEPPPDAVSPKQTQPPHRRQPMPLPTQSAEDTYEVPDHDNESGGSDYEEPIEEQQPPVPHRPPVNKPAQQTWPPVRANNFNVNVADRRMPPLPGRQQKPAPASQAEDMYEEFAEHGGPSEEYEMPMQGGPEEEYEVPESESFPSSGRPPQSAGPPDVSRKPLPPPPDDEPPPALPPKPTKPGPTSHMTTMNKVLPNPTPDTRQAPKLPTSAKSTRPPPLPSPSTKPESPFSGGPPKFPVKQTHVTSPLASGKKPGVKWPPVETASNVKPSQLKPSTPKWKQTEPSSTPQPSVPKWKQPTPESSPSPQPSVPKWKQPKPESSPSPQPSVPKWKQPTPESSPSPQPSVPKWKQTPPAVPSQSRTAGVNRIASQFEARQEATPPKSPGPVTSKVSGLASMFEKQDLPMSPGMSPPPRGTRSAHQSPRTSTLSVASTTSSSSAASSESFADKRASHSSASSASGDSIHDELLPGQRLDLPGGPPALPGRRGLVPPPPPPIASIPSTKAKTRGRKNSDRLPPPPGADRGPPPPPSQGRKPVPSAPLPEPEPLQGGLYEFPWYHGEVEQKQASAALREHGKDGAFLIRKSTKNPSMPYTLALIYQNAIKKVQIRYRSDQKYALGTEKEDEDTFYSVPDLIEFHQTHDILLSQGGKTKLTEAVYKNY